MSTPWHRNISRRFVRVWQRNLTVYQKIWKISFVPPLCEPLFYLLAFGIGFGALVGTITYQGLALSYLMFLAPALLAITIMNNAFFENTYASFVRMYHQKTFDAMLTTPLSDPLGQEIIVVQSKGMERWLSMQLARHHGICANCHTWRNETIGGDPSSVADGDRPRD